MELQKPFALKFQMNKVMARDIRSQAAMLSKHWNPNRDKS